MLSNITETEIRHEIGGVVDTDLDLTLEELSAIKNIKIEF